MYFSSISDSDIFRQIGIEKGQRSGESFQKLKCKKSPTGRVYKYVTEVMLALTNSLFMGLGEGPKAGLPKRTHRACTNNTH